jgi:DNA-directed RNA polymerase specialized sigma24 family protein
LNTGALSNHDRQARLIALAAEVRPELHRYCARLMGSVIDGEDVVQDTLLRALGAACRSAGRRGGRR